MRKFIFSFALVATFIAYIFLSAPRRTLYVNSVATSALATTPTNAQTAPAQTASASTAPVPAKNVSALPDASTQKPAATTPSSQTSAQAAPPPTSTPTPTPAPTPAPAPAPTQNGRFKDGTYTGGVANAYYGNVQVQATVQNGQIADVRFLQYPSDRSTSLFINSQAMPYLKQEAIQAQSAQVNIVSGATETSLAFRTSLASALAQAAN